MCELPDDRLGDCYQKIERNGSLYADSPVVHLLRDAKWVPQGAGNSAVFVQPSEAHRGLLLKDFPYDGGDGWLKTIHFGKKEQQQSEEHKRRQATARELGFADEAALSDAQCLPRFILKNDGLLEEIERGRSPSFQNTVHATPIAARDSFRGELRMTRKNSPRSASGQFLST